MSFAESLAVLHQKLTTLDKDIQNAQLEVTQSEVESSLLRKEKITEKGLNCKLKNDIQVLKIQQAQANEKKNILVSNLKAQTKMRCNLVAQKQSTKSKMKDLQSIEASSKAKEIVWHESMSRHQTISKKHRQHEALKNRTEVLVLQVKQLPTISNIHDDKIKVTKSSENHRKWIEEERMEEQSDIPQISFIQKEIIRYKTRNEMRLNQQKQFMKNLRLESNRITQELGTASISNG